MKNIIFAYNIGEIFPDQKKVINTIITSIFGDPDVKKIKQYKKIVEAIKQEEEKFEKFSLEDIKKKTAEFKNLFSELDFKKPEDSEKIRELLEEIKVPAFALVKTATKKIFGQEFELSDGKKIIWNMIPYDVQLIGGLCIHQGNVAEMKTGEGKTLVATLPAYLNALTGNSVHIVTVNDYLASRDAEEMGILYNTLGLSVGVITNGMPKDKKKSAYNSDVVYATNNELGFDYLRDNMLVKEEDRVQSPHFFCMIDEVDSILIDEARTPLIISAPDNEPTAKYLRFATLAKKLQNNKDYRIDEKQKTATLTEEGIENIEKMLGIENIYISENYNDLHHIENALKAFSVYKKDRDYIVNNGEAMIVDEHTGRVLSGRRYSDGLHQAIEAKEKIEIQRESRTLASITFQNYFRMYWKLSGMTGTAKTEAEEFYKVYSLDTLVIPTNKPIIRDDKKDLLFKNEKGKFEYVIQLIQEVHESKRPILVGTVSVDKSEYISTLLKKAGISHNVLNAKHHEQEADIVANAGQQGAVTIATNMAGRGTDIKLGEGVRELGGLVIIGTEKHETRRIDNQLRGRSGRQGDPGMTQFLISPNDDIMRIFGGDKLFGVFNSPMFAQLPDNEPLTQSGMLTRKVEGVQKQVEGHHFDARKHILEYDDVINKHREIIYKRRNKILASESIHEDIQEMISHQLENLIDANYSDGETDKIALIQKVNDFLGIELIDTTVENDDVQGISTASAMKEYIIKNTLEELELLGKKLEELGNDFEDIERKIVLQSIDELWMLHIDSMSQLRQKVAFVGYEQKNPLVVYKEKAFEKFRDLLGEIEFKTTKAIFSIKGKVEIKTPTIDINELDLNEADIENALKHINSAKKAAPKNSNPLFVNPNTAPKKNNSGKKTKIRV